MKLMKKSSQRLGLGKTIVRIIGLLLLGFVIGVMGLGAVLRIYPKIAPFFCRMQGHTWINLYPGPTGCYRRFADAGKTCVKSNECEAKACEVGGFFGAKNLPDENLVGTCPTFKPVLGDYQLWCGHATIENGAVVEDMRGCMY